jgi:hypothetical protein
MPRGRREFQRKSLMPDQNGFQVAWSVNLI